MKISEVPEEYKMYVFTLSNKKEYLVSGKVKQNILNSQSNLVELGNGGGFNKAFVVSWDINFEATRENVIKNKPKLLC